eukprot:TRINITY_DN8263_c1_g2_i3.p1 TRINITY_DN8263_c1_g2~~TRINITY_DN8263_c1_g2_i3.p1  ORF type:complete len:355 (-),score=34.80 TRINITY_DN8263_c1_g2_i3:623-1615(-)
MSVAPQLGTELPNCPTDGVTQLNFAKDSDLLLVSSWDKTLRIYNAYTQQQQGIYDQSAPILDCEFSQTSAVAFSAGLDGVVRRVDLQNSNVQILGQHQNAVKGIRYFGDLGVLYSGGWDQKLFGWDPRAMSQVLMHELKGRVFGMGAVWPQLVLGLSGRQICVYDVRKMDQPQFNRESSLKYQTRCVECFPNKRAYAVGSVEGRVAIEYYECEEQKKYAFKCHRVKDPQGDIVHPVNAIAFHPSFGTFATGGGDTTVNMWDADNRKRLVTIPHYPQSISALAFNRTGETLAIASNLMISGQGDEEKPTPSHIYLRKMQEIEVKPKPRVQQ